MVGLLDSNNERLRRQVANDIIGHVSKSWEMSAIEERLELLEFSQERNEAP